MFFFYFSDFKNNFKVYLFDLWSLNLRIFFYRFRYWVFVDRRLVEFLCLGNFILNVFNYKKMIFGLFRC